MMELDKQLEKLGWSEDLIEAVRKIASKVKEGAVLTPVLSSADISISSTDDSNDTSLATFSHEGNKE